MLQQKMKTIKKIKTKKKRLKERNQNITQYKKLSSQGKQHQLGSLNLESKTLSKTNPQHHLRRPYIKYNNMSKIVSKISK